MKKVVLKLDLHDDKSKQKAMKTVSGLSGVESITMDMKDKKLTVTGDIDPVTVVAKLRKLCHADILTVGPAKEPEKKKEEPKKEEPKKPDEKKKDPKDDAAAAAAAQAQAYHAYQQQLQAYYQYPPTHMQQHAYLQHAPHMHHQHPHYFSAEEDPNSCVIC